MCIPQTHTYDYQEMTNFMYLPIHDSTFNFPQFHIFSKLEMISAKHFLKLAMILSHSNLPALKNIKSNMGQGEKGTK